MASWIFDSIKKKKKKKKKGLENKSDSQTTELSY